MEAEILARYRDLRAISVRHHNGAMTSLAAPAILEHAKQLGLAQGRRLLVGSEEEMSLVFDLAIYTAKPGRSRAIDRYARSAPLDAGSDEALMLQAMREARFSLWRIERLHDVAGVIVTNLFRASAGEMWLLDEGMARCAESGMVLASRLCRPADFAMTCGVVVPVTAGLLEDLLFELPAPLVDGDLECLGDDPRFAAAVYRAAVGTGLMDQVEYRAPAMAG